MGNTFGHLFRVTTWGESHGDAIGVVVDGCPPRLELSVEDIQTPIDIGVPSVNPSNTPERISALSPSLL